MFMGDEYGVNVFGLEAGFFQAKFQVFKPESAINQKPEWKYAGGLNQRSVA